ncbi:unnamed protein product [Tenebrio molitor]|nr:unnamed protein product [Tenebrio molitor]
MFAKLVLVVNVLVQVYGFDEPLMAQSVLYGVSYLTQEDANSSLCHQELFHLFKSVETHHPWALKAVDASGSPGPGFFYGNNLWLGSYAQCEDLSNTRPFEISYEVVKHPDSTPHDFPPFDLGFFVAHIEHNSTMQHHTQLPLEFTIQLGLCAPKSCSTHDLSLLLTRYLNSKYLTAQNLYDLDLNLALVRSLQPAGLWLLKLPKTIVLLTILSLVVVLAIVGTCYDVRKHNREKNLIMGHRGNIIGKQCAPNVSEVELVSNSSAEGDDTSTVGEIIKCFSVYSNVKNVVKTDLPSDSVTIIHGLKFFGMLWVIMVHAVFYQSDYLTNVPTAYRLSEDIFAQILSNSTYCVDTYLFLSGFLVAYLFFKSRKNSEAAQRQDSYARKVAQFFMMFANRFLRLTPPYVFIILVTDVMYTYYRQSSVLYSSEHNDVSCPKYWWRNLLYINNLFPRTEMCLSWSWYLSVDTQFFAVVTFLLLLSTIKFKTSAVITILLIIGSILSTTYKSYSIRYIPTMDEQLTELDAIYDLPWHRIGPYLVGVITAYIFVVRLQRKLVLKERTRLILWTLFPLLNLWILFTLYTRNLSVEFSAVYMGVSRTLWGIGLGWLVIACCTGNARALEKFLSFPGWIPLSRLTYCAYLLNPLLANMIYMGSNSSLNASKASFGVTSQGVVMSTFFLAGIISVLIESPSILLTKMMFNKLTKSKNSNSA